ncbi:DUF4328 domain-containing protein [Nonomuraea sp. 3-1Str]|uniref:DUF4328 domain-containing protein n=1 Tax=Nonomuraea sp. 3-1Str TaxID=2929801 RepID=UPI0028677E74|nr:DUF4328 domain-containing protein [Nonomuraea sp. 3-1Str]MDR8407764.1 DUF4328 domain-containing protein [Nonomuraea sp. 3-1Str]
MHPAVPAVTLRPVRGMASVAVVTLAAHSLVKVVGAGMNAWQAVIIQRMLVDSDSVRPLEVDVNGALAIGNGVAEVAVFVLAAGAFLVWLRRVRANAEALLPGPHRRARPWVIMGWFVPVVNLWFPKQVVEDVWNASRPGAPAGPLPLARPSVLVWAWWSAFLIGVWVFDVVAVLLWRSDLEAQREAAWVDVVGCAWWTATAALAAFVIMKITRFQEDRRDALPELGRNLSVN